MLFNSYIYDNYLYLDDVTDDLYWKDLFKDSNLEGFPVYYFQEDDLETILDYKFYVLEPNLTESLYYLIEDYKYSSFVITYDNHYDRVVDDFYWKSMEKSQEVYLRSLLFTYKYNMTISSLDVDYTFRRYFFRWQWFINPLRGRFMLIGRFIDQLFYFFFSNFKVLSFIKSIVFFPFFLFLNFIYYLDNRFSFFKVYEYVEEYSIRFMYFIFFIWSYVLNLFIYLFIYLFFKFKIFILNLFKNYKLSSIINLIDFKVNNKKKGLELDFDFDLKLKNTSFSSYYDIIINFNLLELKDNKLKSFSIFTFFTFGFCKLKLIYYMFKNLGLYIWYRFYILKFLQFVLFYISSFFSMSFFNSFIFLIKLFLFVIRLFIFIYFYLFLFILCYIKTYSNMFFFSIIFVVTISLYLYKLFFEYLYFNKEKSKIENHVSVELILLDILILIVPLVILNQIYLMTDVIYIVKVHELFLMDFELLGQIDLSNLTEKEYSNKLPLLVKEKSYYLINHTLQFLNDCYLWFINFDWWLLLDYSFISLKLQQLLIFFYDSFLNFLNWILIKLELIVELLLTLIKMILTGLKWIFLKIFNFIKLFLK